MSKKNEFVTARIREGSDMTEALKLWKLSADYKPKTGDRVSFYEWLETSSRTKEEVDEWFATNASENMVRNRANFDRIWNLVESVRSSYAKLARKAA